MDILDQHELHSRALLADLEEENALSAAAAAGAGDGLYIHKDGQQHEHRNNISSSVSAAAAIPVPASNGSSNQSLLSLRLQGVQRHESEKREESARQNQVQPNVPVIPFQPPPNLFQNAQYNAMFMPSSLPSFPPITDPFSSESNRPGDHPSRVLSHDQLGTGRGPGRPRKTSFDHTVVARHDIASRLQDGHNQLSPVLSSSNLV